MRAGGGHVRVEGIVENTLKESGTEKRGGKTKILKREGGGGASWVKGSVP